ncbi:MAG: C25 family peptidase propeptide domain-containing protein, partial [bacterium]
MTFKKYRLWAVTGIFCLAGFAKLIFPLTKVLEQTHNRLVFEFSIEGLTLDTVTVSGKRFIQVSIKGGQGGTEEGLPDLPCEIFRLGIPVNGNMSVKSCNILDTRHFSSVLPPLPVPHYDIIHGNPVPEYRYSENTYVSRGYYPSSNYEIRDNSMILTIQSVQLVIKPVHYDARNGKYTIVNRMRFNLEFSSNGGLSVNMSQNQLIRMRNSLKQSFLNFNMVSKWHTFRKSGVLSKNISGSDNWQQLW